jgi:hypothetical protein
MNTCTRCPAPARWRDADGRHFCAGHVPANGKPLTRIPAAEIDIVDRLEEGWMEGKALDFHMEAAAEIRRLRALLKAGGDKSGSC